MRSPTPVAEVDQEGKSQQLFRCGPPRVRCLNGSFPLCSPSKSMHKSSRVTSELELLLSALADKSLIQRKRNFEGDASQQAPSLFRQSFRRSHTAHACQSFAEPNASSGLTKYANLQRYYPTIWRTEGYFPAFSLNSRKIHHRLPLPLTCMTALDAASSTSSADVFQGVSTCTSTTCVGNIMQKLGQRETSSNMMACLVVLGKNKYGSPKTSSEYATVLAAGVFFEIYGVQNRTTVPSGCEGFATRFTDGRLPNYSC